MGQESSDYWLFNIGELFRRSLRDAVPRLNFYLRRMNETISAFPSEELYGSALINHDSVAKRRLVNLPGIQEPTSEDAIETLEPTLVFFDTAGSEMFERLEGDGEDAAIQKGSVGEGSRYNENEAEIVAKWARKLVRRAEPWLSETLADYAFGAADRTGCT